MFLLALCHVNAERASPSAALCLPVPRHLYKKYSDVLFMMLRGFLWHAGCM
jgi:hypothetical protein